MSLLPPYPSEWIGRWRFNVRFQIQMIREVIQGGGEVEEINISFSFSPEKQVVFIKGIPDR
jgi:hypothetical protein